MASAIIHLAVAKELEKHLIIKDKKDYYLGSIAPDISKQIGEDRDISHFIINSKKDIPNIDLFTNKYNNFKLNSFNLGYFIHLYTDKLWFGEFMNNIITDNSIKLLDGTILEATPEEITNMIYSDYTDLNIKVIENHDLDLSLFYEDFKIPKTFLNEIPIGKLDILINKMSIIIANSKENKSYSLNIDKVDEFINKATIKILEELQKY